MRSLFVASCALLLVGCQTPEELEAERLQQQQAAAAARAQFDASVARTCAYAIGNQTEYGRCQLQTRMFLVQQLQQMDALAAAQRQNTLNQIINNRPRTTTCTPMYGGGVNCTTQ